MAYTTIDDPSAYFQTDIYTGDGSTTQAQTFDGDSDLQPNFVWIKERSETRSHVLFDTVRGVTVQLNANDNASEVAVSDSLKAFSSDGYSVGPNNSTGKNTETYVAWGWKETADAGFDIVSYTGNGSARTISHSLSAVPDMMIVKNRDETEEWTVYHGANTAAPATDYLSLNSTAATADSNTRWNDTAPTSSVFTVGTSDVVNKNSVAYIAYLFSEKQGYSKFGSYIGNGNANGTFIYTGFRVGWVMIKRTNGTNGWYIYDSTRDPLNQNTKGILAAENDAEQDESGMDLLSNGFKLRNTDGSKNGSSNSYIFMAFAENPLVTSTGIPATAR